RDSGLLRFKGHHYPQKLLTDVVSLFTPYRQFHAAEGFAPAKASFITEDEIDRLLLRGGNFEDGKFRIYSYFMQGHNAQECAQFLRDTYGDGGHSSIGFDEWHDSKGIKYTRQDEKSGFKGYATVQLNWNQVQKRVRALIDSGRYLNRAEQEYLPQYEKRRLAQTISAFFRYVTNEANSNQWDVKDILYYLDSQWRTKKLFDSMLDDFAPLSPDTPHYAAMRYALRDMGAYQRGESPYFSPLPEKALKAEREVNRAEREAKKAEKTQHTPPAEPEDRLAAAARALGRKMQPQAVEDDDGQISFDLFSSPAPESPEVPVAASPSADTPPTVQELYGHYVPIVKDMVLADKAYQNACKNSDQPTARLEGDEAVKRAALALGQEDTAFLRLYYDNTTFHNSLHREIIYETYPTLAQPQQEHEQVGNVDPVPNDEATVIGAEAPWLARLLQGHGISATQFVHENGDVTFSFAAADKDAVEKLIAKLRATINKA
ncbi:MAG: hypothetical protein K2K53_13120, partial [Oscillospiraceae bacterium]|nr:hypothetical protein [Oscillospiraceae bacterium]